MKYTWHYLGAEEASQTVVLLAIIYVTRRKEKTVVNKFKSVIIGVLLMQITRICLIHMVSGIPLSAVKNTLIPMKNDSFSVDIPLW
jgi:hypothetical protein